MHLHINMYRNGAYSGRAVPAAITRSLWAAQPLHKNPLLAILDGWRMGGISQVAGSLIVPVQRTFLSSPRKIVMSHVISIIL